MSAAAVVHLFGGECARRRYAHCFHQPGTSERTIAWRKLWRASTISVETAERILRAAATQREPALLEGADCVLVVTFDVEGAEELELTFPMAARRHGGSAA